MFEQMGSESQTLNVILKTDVRGSLEAILGALDELSTDEVKVRVISSGVGAITESDAILAESSAAALIGFNVRADTQGKKKPMKQVWTFVIIASSMAYWMMSKQP